MKNYLKSDVEARGFFKTWIAFLIPIIILYAISNQTDESLPLLSLISSLAESYLMMLMYFAVFIYLIRFVTFRDKGFIFSGKLGEIAPKLLKWYMLTIITIGIYSPWMIRNIADFCFDRFDYDGRRGEFLSKPGTLLKYMLLTMYLPMLILTVIFTFFMIKYAYYYNYALMALPVFIFIVVVFLIIIPFMFYYFLWLINIRFDIYTVVFKRSMSEFAGFLIPQILLSIISLFIYYPAACVKIYRYLLEGSAYIDQDDAEKGGFGFDGTTGKGFCLLWGQGLLTLITVGIYGPWAMAKLSNYFLNNTYISSVE